MDMKILLCLCIFLEVVLFCSARVLSSYGCYTTIGRPVTAFPLARSIKPINADDSILEDINIVCISLVKGAEFKTELKNGTIIDLSNKIHGMSLILPRLEVSIDLYGPSLEYIVVSSCVKAEIIATLHSNTKLDLLQPFVIFKCMQTFKRNVLISPNVSNYTRGEAREVEYWNLGSEVPFNKRPYECKFESLSFNKEGKLITHRKRRLFWTCFSKVDRLLVFNLFTKTQLHERDLVCFVDNMDNSAKIAIKSPCNGLILESNKGVLNYKDIFMRVECNEENLPNLFNNVTLGIMNKSINT